MNLGGATAGLLISLAVVAVAAEPKSCPSELKASQYEARIAINEVNVKRSDLAVANQIIDDLRGRISALEKELTAIKADKGKSEKGKSAE